MSAQYTTKPINPLQNNTQHSNLRTHTSLNETAGKYDIILIQIPWIGNIGGESLMPQISVATSLLT
jgi:hypothetical protein